MLIVADTSPLNYLVQVGHQALLPLLYRRIIIPRFPASCHKGESQAIALCLESSQHILLIDDRPARRFAESLGVHCVGLLGTLRAAHNAKIVDGFAVLALLKKTTMFIPADYSL